jgi:hypothetical protein
MNGLKTTILFGNGIGRAIDNDYFNLANVINHVFLTFEEDQRNLIELNQGHPPLNEEEFDRFHQVLTCCNKLKSFETNKNIFLTDNASRFPNVYSNFIKLIAMRLYDFNNESSNLFYINFISGLVDFLKSHACHVATLNYDKLLYKPFVINEILKGYDGYLIDGVWNESDGYQDEHMRRNNEKKLGWYLHLHGSPIYYSKQNKIFKFDYDNPFDDKATFNHLVIGPTKVKPYLIIESELLSSYWNYFQRALEESETLILFGYSGNDKHVNKICSNCDNLKNIIIVEHNHNNESEEASDNREEFWSGQLGKSNSKILIKRYLNILDCQLEELIGLIQS